MAGALGMAVVVALSVSAATGAATTLEHDGGGSGSTSGPDLEVASSPAPERQTVTLLTGDRVTITTLAGDHRAVEVRPGSGRSGVAFAEQETADGGLRVVPADALELIAAGRIDPRLFDITGLLAQGYDDASTRQLPLIVQYDDAPRARRSAPAALTRAGAVIERPLPSIHGAAVTAPKKAVGALWREIAGTPSEDAPGAAVLDAGVARVHLDGRVRAALDQSIPQIGAPAAWDAGYTGDGVLVAVLDSGIDAGHPDVSDAVVRAADFTEDDEGMPGHDPTDRFGHGTHVASIIAGDGAASDGRYAGVAPDAGLVIGKVLNDYGEGEESWIIAGMEWAVDQGADVVNLSLGGCATDGSDPLSEALNALTERSGTLFVAAAGNHPSSLLCTFPETVAAPAAADRALAVGSVDKQGELSGFSNTGPRVRDGLIKPELTAPGESIVAARASDTLWDDAVDDHYARLSGTSMAAPHVTGVAALLAEQHPDWSADELVPALLSSAVPHPKHGAFRQGAGRVDAARAVAQDIVASPAALSLGVTDWPHSDDEPIAETLTYRNAGDQPVSLDLDVTAFADDGSAAPEAMFSVAPAAVTVPAGGSADVVVTADTSIDAPDGGYSGWVSGRSRDAAGDDLPAVTTPVGVVKEVEAYDLTIEVVDRTGAPAWTTVTLGDLAAEQLRDVPVPGRPVTVRLPAGQYDLTSHILTAGTEDTDSFTLAARPELVLDRDMTVSLDARDASLIEAVVDSPIARPGLRRAHLSTYRLVSGIATDIETFELYATPTPEVTAYDYAFGYQSALNEPEPAQEGADSPVAGNRLPRGYQLFISENGRIPEPSFRFRDSDLARLDTTLHGQGVPDEQPARLLAYPTPVDDEGFVWGQMYDVRMPGRRIDLYSANTSIRWGSELRFGDVQEDDYDRYSYPDYRAGRRYEKHWNAAPLGPVARPTFAYGHLWVTLAPFSSSSPGHVTYPGWDGIEATTTLRKDGEVIGVSDDPSGGFFALEPDHARYELTTSVNRDVGWSALGTRMEARWNVDAGPDDATGRLPLLALRTRGDVDVLGRAPAHRPFRLDVSVERADGTDPAVRELDLEASFDDGDSWTPMRLRPARGGFIAWVPRAPAGSDFVSLRGHVVDAGGSELEQTVIRAYRLTE
ncbi:S8 family peptidase [Phytoactinopolyspora halotolerans]|uniref:S8 family serine peptidase n=1 Tax=Phytoactinopolyspora halotolerans TaxID=1981512 RepID=A0A6L9SBC9_9ACTN|nr:S8 family serine peptidase [Phytoactinopolyspora halotolerans]NEE01851.1 S8 family serine peptidase [Phytoactinopolyspora halotolerans]